MRKLKYIIFPVLFFLSEFSFAQSPTGTIGSWYMFNNQTRLHKNWSLHMETQYRSYETSANTEQVLLRSGVNYHFTPGILVSMGYAYIINYAFDKELNPGVQRTESRFWQQFIMRNNLGRFLLEHRYRLEQRALESKTSVQYSDRFRYCLRLSVPVNRKVIEKGSFFLSMYDEVFINLAPGSLDRNRWYGAVGYQFLPNGNLQLGYLLQTVNTTTKPYLQLGIVYNVDLRRN